MFQSYVDRQSFFLSTGGLPESPGSINYPVLEVSTSADRVPQGGALSPERGQRLGSRQVRARRERGGAEEGGGWRRARSQNTSTSPCKLGSLTHLLLEPAVGAVRASRWLLLQPVTQKWGKGAFPHPQHCSLCHSTNPNYVDQNKTKQHSWLC